MDSAGTANPNEPSKPMDLKMRRERGKKIQKRRVKKAQKKQVEKVAPPPPPPKKQTFSSKDSSSRSYADDLQEYITTWERRDQPGANWKFSKVIQSWALENCFQKDKIEASLFKRLLPYISSVQGIARQRLLDVALELIEKCENGSELVHDDDDDVVVVDTGEDDPDSSGTIPKNTISKKMLKRAKKVCSILATEE